MVFSFIGRTLLLLMNRGWLEVPRRQSRGGWAISLNPATLHYPAFGPADGPADGGTRSGVQFIAFPSVRYSLRQENGAGRCPALTNVDLHGG